MSSISSRPVPMPPSRIRQQDPVPRGGSPGGTAAAPRFNARPSAAPLPVPVRYSGSGPSASSRCWERPRWCLLSDSGRIAGGASCRRAGPTRPWSPRLTMLAERSRGCRRRRASRMAPAGKLKTRGCSNPGSWTVQAVLRCSSRRTVRPRLSRLPLISLARHERTPRQHGRSSCGHVCRRSRPDRTGYAILAGCAIIARRLP